MKKLNLGCGKDWAEKGADWDGLDIANFNQKYVCDVTKEGIPCPDNTYDLIWAENVLEHFSPGDEIIFIMNECWRVLVWGGIMEIIVPRFPHSNSVSDPTHK